MNEKNLEIYGRMKFTPSIFKGKNGILKGETNMKKSSRHPYILISLAVIVLIVGLSTSVKGQDHGGHGAWIPVAARGRCGENYASSFPNATCNLPTLPSNIWCDADTDNLCWLSSGTIACNADCSTLGITIERRFSCADPVAGVCKTSYHGYGTLGECQSTCRVGGPSTPARATTQTQTQPAPATQPETVTQAKPTPSPVTPRYTCVDKKTRLCQEDKSGVWADKTACETECKEKEVDVKSCKENYQKQRSVAKAERTLSSKLAKEEYPEEIEELLQDIISEAKTIEKIADENSRKTLCDTENTGAFEEKTKQFSDLTLELETFLAEEEKQKESYKAPEELIERARREGFREEIFEQNAMALLMRTVFDQPQELFDISSIRSGIENLLHIGAKFQQELSGSKENLFKKVSGIEKMLSGKKISDEEKAFLKDAVEICLQPIYDTQVTGLVEAKFTQVALDIQKGESLDDLAVDLQSFCSKRNAENNQLLYRKGAVQFADVDTHEWYFEVFQNPKQIAMKGFQGQVDPKGTLKKVEALLAIPRTLQTPKVEEGSCGNPDIPKTISETPSWGICAVDTALKQVGGGKEGITKLRLAGSVIEPVTREQFALFVWHLTRAEVLTKNVLKAPDAETKESLCKSFKDCGSFNGDGEVKEAVAAMKANGLMIGRGGDVWGFGQTLLRAEAAKVLLLLQGKITQALPATFGK